MDSPEQFNQELIKWKMRNNDNSTSGITSLEEAIKICDADFFPNILVIFKLFISLPVGSLYM